MVSQGHMLAGSWSAPVGTDNDLPVVDCERRYPHCRKIEVDEGSRETLKDPLLPSRLAYSTKSTHSKPDPNILHLLLKASQMQNALFLEKRQELLPI